MIIDKERKEAYKILDNARTELLFQADYEYCDKISEAIDIMLQDNKEKDEKIRELEQINIILMNSTNTTPKTAIEIVTIQKQGYLEGQAYEYAKYKKRIERLMLQEKQKLINELKERKNKNEQKYGEVIYEDDYEDMYEYCGRIKEDEWLLNFIVKEGK